MNTKRIFFWIAFIVVLGLIIWGLVAAMNKPPAPAKQYGDAPAVTATDHVRGPANAKVTLIEYSDFQCPACEAYEPLIEQLEADASSTLRLVYRHYPLPMHPNALPAAYASEAASLQGKFWEMHDMLFDKHAEWTELADPSAVFAGYASKLGLDVAKFKADSNSPAVKAVIQASLDQVQTLGLDYTPTFYVNGKVITNPQGYGPFKSLIEAAASGSSN